MAYLYVVVMSTQVDCDTVFLQQWPQPLHQTLRGTMVAYRPDWVVTSNHYKLGPSDREQIHLHSQGVKL